jgi:hypothetical protein
MYVCSAARSGARPTFVCFPRLSVQSAAHLITWLKAHVRARLGYVRFEFEVRWCEFQLVVQTPTVCTSSVSASQKKKTPSHLLKKKKTSSISKKKFISSFKHSKTHIGSFLNTIWTQNNLHIYIGPVRSDLSVVPFQRNNSVFLSQQISISRFSSQLNRAYTDTLHLLAHPKR